MKPALLALALSLCTGCTFHSTATSWNSRMGPNGRPVHVKSTSNVGMNLFVLFKIFGATDVDGMIDELTEAIGEENGDRVRVIQSESENYWYGFPPLTWFVTPVVTTVAAEYEPPQASESPEDDATQEDATQDDGTGEETAEGAPGEE